MSKLDVRIERGDAPPNEAWTQLWLWLISVRERPGKSDAGTDMAAAATARGGRR